MNGGPKRMEETLTAWEDGWRVRLPLPFPLKWIYAYLIKERDGYTVVDCGLHYNDAVRTWEKTLQTLNIRWQDIHRIILTHYHPDHYGFAGRMQQESGAEIWMSRTTYEQAQRFWGPASCQQDEALSLFFRRHGLPVRMTRDMTAHLRTFHDWVSPHPVNPQFLDPGMRLSLGGHPYEIWPTPGHAEGHLSFYDQTRKWLIGGDILLRKISPNISLLPGGDPNPLKTFLSTLGRLQTISIRRVFPAHGPVFTDTKVRIAELIQHHQERLQYVRQLLEDRPQTVYDVCGRLFGHNLSFHNLRFALAETLAHLEYLRYEEEVDVNEQECAGNVCVYYQPAVG